MATFCNDEYVSNDYIHLCCDCAQAAVQECPYVSSDYIHLCCDCAQTAVQECQSHGHIFITTDF